MEISESKSTGAIPKKPKRKSKELSASRAFTDSTRPSTAVSIAKKAAARTGSDGSTTSTLGSTASTIHGSTTDEDQTPRGFGQPDERSDSSDETEPTPAILLTTVPERKRGDDEYIPKKPKRKVITQRSIEGDETSPIQRPGSDESEEHQEVPYQMMNSMTLTPEPQFQIGEDMRDSFEV